MINLVSDIREVERKIHQIKVQCQKDIEPLREKLIELRKLNEACENCAGKGKVLRPRSCAEDDKPNPKDPEDYVSCYKCHGTGHKQVGW